VPGRLSERWIFLCDLLGSFIRHSQLVLCLRCFQLYQRASRSLLFGFLFCASLSAAQAIAIGPDFDMKNLAVIRAAFFHSTVLGWRTGILLEKFLKSGFPVGIGDAFAAFFDGLIEKHAAEKFRGSLKA